MRLLRVSMFPFLPARYRAQEGLWDQVLRPQSEAEASGRKPQVGSVSKPCRFYFQNICQNHSPQFPMITWSKSASSLAKRTQRSPNVGSLFQACPPSRATMGPCTGQPPPGPRASSLNVPPSTPAPGPASFLWPFIRPGMSEHPQFLPMTCQWSREATWDTENALPRLHATGPEHTARLLATLLRLICCSFCPLFLDGSPQGMLGVAIVFPGKGQPERPVRQNWDCQVPLRKAG